MSNSQFTEARRKKNDTRIRNLQSKSAQPKYSSSEDSGIQSFLKREKRETHPTPRTFQLYCLQTFWKQFEAKANHFASKGLFPGAGGTFVTEEETQQAGKLSLSFLGKGCMKIQSIPLGLLIRIPGVQEQGVPLNPWNN